MAHLVTFIVLCFVALAAGLPKDSVPNTSSLANTLPEEDAKGTPRFGFLSVDDTGAILTFNSTSLQYAVVIGVVLLVLGLIVVPLFGLDLANLFSSRDGYDNYNYAYDQGNTYSSYSSYAKRSLDMLHPVLAALAEAYKKYE